MFLHREHVYIVGHNSFNCILGITLVLSATVFGALIIVLTKYLLDSFKESADRDG